MMDGIVLTNDVDCLDLCDILRLKLTGYVDKLNLAYHGRWQHYGGLYV